MKTIQSKVALFLSRKSVAQLILFARTIVLMMTGNAFFATPAPPLSDISKAADLLEKAEEQKKATGIENRNIKRQKLEALLTKEGSYVEDIANGDGGIIQSAGMQVVKARTPKNLPGEVKGVTVTDGNNLGEVIVNHKGATGTGNEYYTEYSTDMSLNEKNWQYVEPTGKHSVLIKNLPTGQKVAFRVSAKNTAGFGPWSAIVFRTIQQ